MATYTGKDGRVYARAPSGDLTAPTTPVQGTGTLIGQVRDFRLTINRELLDQTVFGDEWRQSAAGLRNWDATVTLVLDPTTTVNHDELLESLQPDDFSGTLASSSQVQLDLYVDGETSGSNKKAYYGAAFVESADIGVGVDGLVEATLRCRGNGALKATIVGA